MENKIVLTESNIQNSGNSKGNMVYGVIFLVVGLLFSLYWFKPLIGEIADGISIGVFTKPNPNSIISGVVGLIIFLIFSCAVGIRLIITSAKNSKNISLGEYVIEKDVLIDQEWINNDDYRYRNLVFKHNRVKISDIHTKYKYGDEFYIVKFECNKKKNKGFADGAYPCDRYKLGDDLKLHFTTGFTQKEENKIEGWE